ncbi:MAG: RnfABCDGE type electron transport complex subunit G [Lentimicrobium sp.]|nr:RnfABCDGE type electron transport complex subunit G [Lentimicrobium sp.]
MEKGWPMAKLESSFRNMVVVLLVITLVASLSLAAVYNVTKQPIEAARQAKKEKAIKKVLPVFGQLEEEAVLPPTGKDPVVVYKAFNADTLVGYAVETYSDNGFGGRIQLMIGFLPDLSIYNTAVLKHMETPGLGDKMDVEKSNFPVQFERMKAESFPLAVKKDGGAVDAITAATISSRAFVDGVNRAYETLKAKGDKQ